MIPYTFPSFLKEDGTTACRVKVITDVTGLVRWIDYTPIKFVNDSSFVNTYSNVGCQAVQIETNFTGLVSGIDYIVVYVDDSAYRAWSTDIGGYIPCYGGPITHLITEDGFNLLQEDGFLILLENSGSPLTSLMTEDNFFLLKEDDSLILLEN